VIPKKGENGKKAPASTSEERGVKMYLHKSGIKPLTSFEREEQKRNPGIGYFGGAGYLIPFWLFGGAKKSRSLLGGQKSITFEGSQKTF